MVDPGAGIPQYTLNRSGGGVIFKYKDKGEWVKYSNVRTKKGGGQGLNIRMNTKGRGFKYLNVRTEGYRGD